MQEEGKREGKKTGRDVAKVFNRRKSSNDRRVFGPKAHSIPRGVRGHAFSLILGAKSRAFRTDVYQVTGNKVMMNCSLDCF